MAKQINKNLELGIEARYVQFERLQNIKDLCAQYVFAEIVDPVYLWKVPVNLHLLADIWCSYTNDTAGLTNLCSTISLKFSTATSALYRLFQLEKKPYHLPSSSLYD